MALAMMPVFCDHRHATVCAVAHETRVNLKKAVVMPVAGVAFWAAASAANRTQKRHHPVASVMIGVWLLIASSIDASSKVRSLGDAISSKSRQM
jgi:hypothetical protein